MSTTTIDRLNGINSGVAIKAPVRAATTANITLSAEQTVDGIALVAGDRVLVKDQTSSIDNGIYEVATSSWSRTPDFDGSNDVVTGTTVYVNSGTTNANTAWQVTTTGTILPGTSACAWTQSANLTGVTPFLASYLLKAGGAMTGNLTTTSSIILGGSTSANNVFGTTPDLQVNTVSSGDGTSLSRWQNNVNGHSLFFQKSRGTSIGSYTILQSGDDIGSIYFSGSNGTGFTNAAAIVAEVDGTPGASNDMPGRMVFYTTPDGSGTVTERMRIDSAGNIGIGGTANANAIVHVQTTAKQAIPAPPMTTAQKNSLTGVSGGQVFDTTLTRPAWYNGSAWEYAPFGKRFTSADQTVSSAGLLTVAHSLGVTPFLVKVWLKCLTAELNYTIGDLVEAPSASSSSAADNHGFALKRDATNVYVRFGSNANPLRLPDWTTGASTTLTNANWALVIEAFA